MAGYLYWLILDFQEQDKVCVVIYLNYTRYYSFQSFFLLSCLLLRFSFENFSYVSVLPVGYLLAFLLQNERGLKRISSSLVVKCF